jgi:hypothetical protein
VPVAATVNVASEPALVERLLGCVPITGIARAGVESRATAQIKIKANRGAMGWINWNNSTGFWAPFTGFIVSTQGSEVKRKPVWRGTLRVLQPNPAVPPACLPGWKQGQPAGRPDQRKRVHNRRFRHAEPSTANWKRFLPTNRRVESGLVDVAATKAFG